MVFGGLRARSPSVRQRKRKRAALAQRRLDRDVTAMGFDERAADVEPQAEPLGAAASRLNAVEAIEYMWERLGGDADTGVRNRHQRRTVGGPNAHGNRAAVRGVLDGVRE